MIELVLTDNNIKEFEKSINENMDKVIKHFERELVAIRTGRAHTSLVENIKVSCYGNTLNLKELASISTPESRLLVIQPWDKTIIADIERAIANSEVGVAPVNDGNLIRIKIPEMSGARRDDLVKVLHKKLEDGRISIRNIRKDFHNLIRDSEKNKTISEDHSRRLNETLQKITDKFIQTVEQMSHKKETDIKTV